MAQIVMSEQVRDLLGAQGAAYVEAYPLDGARCQVCRGDLAPAGPATVLVLRGPVVTSVVFAHPRCSPSAVIDVPDRRDGRGGSPMSWT